MDASEKYGKLKLVRGGQYARRPTRPTVTAVDWQLDREMASAFAAIHGADGTVPSHGIYDIREGNQHPWRVLARRIREARAVNAPKDQVEGVLKVFADWIDALYSDQSGRAA